MTQQQERRTASGHKVGEVIDYGWAGSKPQQQIIAPVEGGQWIVVQSEHRQERTAVDALRDKGFTEIFLPEYEAKVKRGNRFARSKRARGAFVIVTRVLFPSYLFLRTVIATEEWKRAFSCLGVHGLLCAGDAPAAVPDLVIEKIMAAKNCGISAAMPDLPFAAGQKARVDDGPFASFVGLIEEIKAGRLDESAQAQVLLSLFGRQTRITLSVDALSRADDDD